MIYNTGEVHRELSSDERLICLKLETLPKRKTEKGLLQKGN
jgi:hypothetical protein